MEHDRRLILSSGFGCLHSVFGFSFTSISQARLSFLHVMNERKKVSIVDMRSLSCWGGGGVDGVHQELMAAKFTVCLCVCGGLCFLLHKKHHFWCHKGTIYNGF